MQVKLPSESMWNIERVVEVVSHIHTSLANSRTLEFQSCHKKQIIYFNTHVSCIPLSSVGYICKGKNIIFLIDTEN